MDQASYARLTPKERDCLRVIGRDLSTEQIAVQLNVSPGRAANLIKAVRLKLGGVDRYTAARRFREFENGLTGDVPEKDLPAWTPPQQEPERRPQADANVVREERVTFDWGNQATADHYVGSRSNGLHTVVMIAALVAMLALCGALAFPLSQGWQHLANLVDPPRRH